MIIGAAVALALALALLALELPVHLLIPCLGLVADMAVDGV